MLSIALCTSTVPHRKIGFPFCWHVRGLKAIKYLSRRRKSTLQGLHVCFQQGQHHVSVLWRQGQHWSVPYGSCLRLRCGRTTP
ncbi:hypothetical protein GGI35DRAFT_387942 [Trichoderma velutinum]